MSGRELRINANIEKFGDNGVIISQGGSLMGYSLYVKDGKVHFAVRHTDKLHEVEAPATPEIGKSVRIRANLKLDGVMSLKVGKNKPATLKTPGVFSQTPGEGLVVGNDPAGTVADYPRNFRFNGVVKSLVVRVSEVNEPFPAPGKNRQQVKAKHLGKETKRGQQVSRAAKRNRQAPTTSTQNQ